MFQRTQEPDAKALLKDNEELKRKLNLRTREGWDAMEKEINDRGKHLGGCWLPATTGSFHPRLIEWLVTWFNVRSVCDVGCGGGEALKHFRALGCQVVGIEGLNYAAVRTGVPTICHDMETGPIKLYGIDCMYSIEYLEHCANTDSSLDTLCQSKIIACSTAQVGQSGHNHVSLYPREWWIERIEKRGYIHQPKLTEIAVGYAGGYFGQNGYIFVKNTAMDEYGLERCDYET